MALQNSVYSYYYRRRLRVYDAFETTDPMQIAVRNEIHKMVKNSTPICMLSAVSK